MAILRFAYLLLTIACYSPEVRDCVVACTGAADCAPAQVCGEDGFCAAAAVAGTCATIAATDAGVDAPGDKPQPDARPDATPPPATVRIWVRIEGRGVVMIPAVGNCDGGSGQMECQFDVPQGAPTTLHASPKQNWRFERWDDACKDAPTATCVISPTTDSDVRARFEMLDDDD
jgi:hypothetical protein